MHNRYLLVGPNRSRANNQTALRDDRKAAVFVIASAAGGSGAGMTIDILRMIEDMRNKDELKAKAASVFVLLVGGGAFTDERGERIDSNTFALLRELDRLTAVAGRPLNRAVPPVMLAPAPVGRFSSRLGPADMIYYLISQIEMVRHAELARVCEMPILNKSLLQLSLIWCLLSLTK